MVLYYALRRIIRLAWKWTWLPGGLLGLGIYSLIIAIERIDGESNIVSPGFFILGIFSLTGSVAAFVFSFLEEKTPGKELIDWLHSQAKKEKEYLAAKKPPKLSTTTEILEEIERLKEELKEKEEEK